MGYDDVKSSKLQYSFNKNPISMWFTMEIPESLDFNTEY